MKYVALLLCSCVFPALWAQDTFSILAVDPQTGQVGSAGATCLDVVREGASARIISDVIPGIGAIHTQSYWDPGNQARARQRMLAGDPPQAIIDWLVENDVQSNPQVRQYGVIDLGPAGQARAAAFTGTQCIDYKGQRIGGNYAIQGNILLGPQVLQAMETNFLTTTGSLAEKLMAAMRGARIPGADRRCQLEGVSSRSAFLRVALPADHPNQLYLDLEVDATTFAQDPIDALEYHFHKWLLTNTPESFPMNFPVRIFPNPVSGMLILDIPEQAAIGPVRVRIFTTTGKLLWERQIDQTPYTFHTRRELGPLKGAGLVQIVSLKRGMIYSGKLLFLD